MKAQKGGHCLLESVSASSAILISIAPFGSVVHRFYLSTNAIPKNQTSST